ncbi:hypothetical protein FACS189485_03220 [Spirochaetia bacterium]|nr:hypothetical protein FACS189485_03220 [Spirochaetia bacterium]
MHNFYNMVFFHNIHHVKRHIDHFFGHGQVLTALLQKGPLAQSELLEIVDSKRQSADGAHGIPLGKTLSELEKRRLIKREGKGGDVFSLTKRGEHFAGRLQIHERLIQMSESLSEEEKDQFTVILEKMRSNRDEAFSHFHFRGSHFDFDHGHDHHTQGRTGNRGNKE